MDRLSPAQRSWLMSRIKAKDTVPELRVRRLAHALGYRFRLHQRELPGSPDLVFPKLKSVIFVHGCFWHRHEGCPRAPTPVSNQRYWKAKFDRNVQRDEAAKARLRSMGWRVLIVWECQTRDAAKLEAKLHRFLG